MIKKKQQQLEHFRNGILKLKWSSLYRHKNSVFPYVFILIKEQVSPKWPSNSHCSARSSIIASYICTLLFCFVGPVQINGSIISTISKKETAGMAPPHPSCCLTAAGAPLCLSDCYMKNTEKPGFLRSCLFGVPGTASVLWTPLNYSPSPEAKAVLHPSTRIYCTACHFFFLCLCVQPRFCTH